MTDLTIPRVTLAELGDYTSRDGHVIRPGAYFVSHGGGRAGYFIRTLTQSWAGHAGIHLGSGRIIEGAPPKSRITAADDHPEAIWNIHEDLTDEQRLEIVAQAHAMKDRDYDWEAYAAFILEWTHLRNQKQLDDRFRMNEHRICSALVDDCYMKVGIDLKPSATVPNMVTPDDLLRRLINMGRAPDGP